MKRLISFTLAATAALTFAAQANSDHWDKFSCYAYVHAQCYNNGAENCSDEGYAWGLNECDGYYPSTTKQHRLAGSSELKSPATGTHKRKLVRRD